MADEKVKLPRSSYEELCKIIIAYGRLTQASSLDQVNALAGVGKTVVSANNSFLTVAGLIEGGKAKSATEHGKQLARALEHNIPDEIRTSWEQVVERNDFLSKMALAVRIRKTIDESTFISHIAYSAGEAKSSYVMTGARTVVDILRASGHITEEDGKLTSRELGADTVAESPRVDERLASTEPGMQVSTQLVKTAIPSPHASLSLSIEVRVDAKPSELDGLGDKLRKIIDALRGTGPSE
ncbi:MAG: hypothetical protein AB1473_16660 [Thermodesulfobacteriota bacterium]